MTRRPPRTGREAFLAEVQACLDEADAGLRHALRHALTWGWTPGSSTVRHVLGEVTPYAGLAYWLPRGLGSVEPYSTVSLNTKPPNGES